MARQGIPARMIEGKASDDTGAAALPGSLPLPLGCWPTGEVARHIRQARQMPPPDRDRFGRLRDRRRVATCYDRGPTSSSKNSPPPSWLGWDRDRVLTLQCFRCMAAARMACRPLWVSVAAVTMVCAWVWLCAKIPLSPTRLVCLRHLRLCRVYDPEDCIDPVIRRCALVLPNHGWLKRRQR